MNNKDLIAQYVDTGLLLPEHQVIQLPGWGVKSYMRKRLMAIDNGDRGLKNYEFRLLDDKGKWEYYIINEKNNGIINLDFLDETPDDMKLKLIEFYISKETTISGWVGNLFDAAPLELKRKWLEVQIVKGREIEAEWIQLMSDELLTKFVDNEVKIKLKHGYWANLSGSIYGGLPYTLKVKVINAYINAGDIKIGNWHLWAKTPENLQKHFVKYLASGKYNIDPEFYEEISNEIKLEYLEYHIAHLKKIRGDNWHVHFSDKRRDDYERLKNNINDIE